MRQLVYNQKRRLDERKAWKGRSLYFKDFEGQAALLSSKAVESVAKKSAMSTGLHAGPVEHKGGGQETISDICSTDWQKKDSAFLSSVAFL